MSRSVATKTAKNLITIIGTTGVGKSQLSVELAKALNGEIINGDSMQMYQGLDNITNKHPIPEREGIPHHLLGHISWKDEYSVTQFEDEALSIIDDIHSRGKVPILVGGTHYYTQSVLFKNSIVAESNERKDLTEEQIRILDDPPSVMETLKKVDPVIAEKFHPNDTRRLRRALEIYYTNGKRASDIYDEQLTGGNEARELRFRSLIFWIWSEQGALNPRLDARVDQMLENGLYDEVNQMYSVYSSEKDIDLERGVWQVIGFKQFLPWLKGEEATADSGIEQMKSITRKYAKKQIKWILKKLLYLMNQVVGMGDVALLDATDLSKWNENVRQRGISIAKDFLDGKSPYSEPLAPPGLESMLKVRTEEESFHKEKWKHFQCETCKDAQGVGLIYVGEQVWNEHLQSRKHRNAVKREQNRLKLEEYKARMGISND